MILCRDKVPYTASVRNGPKATVASLVDEYVCETMQGEDCMKASERYVMKAADAYKSDIDIPFTFRNNVALILHKVQNGVPSAN